MKGTYLNINQSSDGGSKEPSMVIQTPVQANNNFSYVEALPIDDPMLLRSPQSQDSDD